MPFILRSKNRPGFDSAYASYEPESISAWSESPDLSMAPAEAWEEVADVAAAYAAAPAFAVIQAPAEEPT